jgi:hypothetical protein
MQDESKHDEDEYRFPEGCVNPYAESLVIQQVLGHADGYPLKQVQRNLDELPPGLIENSIKSLEKVGVVVVKDTRLHMTEPLKRLADLSMVGM